MTATNGLAPSPSPEQDRIFEFKVRIRSFGKGDRRHLLTVAAFLWKGLHRAFGRDRCWVYLPDGRRVIFDDLAADGEHEGHDQPLSIEGVHARRADPQ